MENVASQFVEGCDIQLNDYENLMGAMGSGYVKSSKKAIRKYDIDKILLSNGYEFKFECPLLPSEMKKYPGDNRYVDCRVCFKKVYIVNDIEDFNTKITQGKCVSFDPHRLFKSSFAASLRTEHINKKPRESKDSKPKHRFSERTAGKVVYR